MASASQNYPPGADSTPLISGALNGFAIALSDTVDLPNITRGIYVGTGGDIVLNLQDYNGTATTLTFKAVPQGVILPVRCSRVKSTNTTASNLVGLY